MQYVGKGRANSKFNTTVSSTEECSDYFNVFKETDKHNNDMGTISTYCNYSWSWSPILEPTSDSTPYIDLDNYCRQVWISTSSEFLDALDQSGHRDFWSRCIAWPPSSSILCEEQVDILPTTNPKNTFVAIIPTLYPETHVHISIQSNRSTKSSFFSVLVPCYWRVSGHERTQLFFDMGLAVETICS